MAKKTCCEWIADLEALTANRKPGDLVKALKACGWTSRKRGKSGNHPVWRHPKSKRPFPYSPTAKPVPIYVVKNLLDLLREAADDR